MKSTTNHTATFRGRRVTIILTSGERVTGKFVERTANKRIVLIGPDGHKSSYERDSIRQFLSGQNTRGTSCTTTN